MNEKWITDKRPEKLGVYWVTIEHQERKLEGNRIVDTGKVIREVDTRHLVAPGECDNWAMPGEDTSKPYWISVAGSYSDEKVVAWMEYEEPLPYMGENADNADNLGQRLTTKVTSLKSAI